MSYYPNYNFSYEELVSFQKAILSFSEGYNGIMSCLSRLFYKPIIDELKIHPVIDRIIIKIQLSSSKLNDALNIMAEHIDYLMRVTVR